MNYDFEHYDNIIRNLGRELIKNYDDSKSVPPGINGPYNDPETPVRNICHLIVTTSIEILVFNKDELKSTLKNMADDLLSHEVDGLFILRQKKGKDKCNGVIGHAWIMEALVYLYKVFKRKFYIEKAIDIYNEHKFNINLKLWNTPKAPFGNGKVDNTFNHQLWFAAISSELYKISSDEKILKELNFFMGNLSSLTNINNDGLICHYILRSNSSKRAFKLRIKRTIDILSRFFNKPSYEYKENGYHIFNVAAFARLYKINNKNKFWTQKKFAKIMEYINNPKLLQSLLSHDIAKDKSLNIKENLQDKANINIYGFPYNVPAFELYYIKKVFTNWIKGDTLNAFLKRQMELTYDENNKCFNKNCYDSVTINYRVYEYYKAFEESGYYI